MTKKICYNNLWKMLIDKDMTRKDLRKASGVSTASIAKLGRGDNITTDVLVKICDALDCNITEIMELTDAPSPDVAMAGDKAWRA